MDIEWTSQISIGACQTSASLIECAAMYAWNACPASCVNTSTSAEVPLKFEKMNGALSPVSVVQ